MALNAGWKRAPTVSRRLSCLNGTPRKVDGGALFGSTPRQVWEQWMRPDQEHRVELPSRALLVQEPDRNILVLSGCELLLAPLPRTCNCQPRHSGLLDSLARLGLGENDIDLVLLTHLHASPSPQQWRVIDEGQVLRVLFPRARYLTGTEHWRRALRPHPLDRNRFFPWILRQLEHGGRLNQLNTNRSAVSEEEFEKQLQIRNANGRWGGRDHETRLELAFLPQPASSGSLRTMHAEHESYFLKFCHAGLSTVKAGYVDFDNLRTPSKS